MLSGRRVLLGVTGGVAAYKSAYLARRLVEAGAEVRTILTRSASEFLGAQTLAAITGTQPGSALFGEESVSPHTELAAWAEVIVVAPATASFLGHIASGISDDLLTTTVLAARSPVVVAPAMHTEMWEHPATVDNVTRLRTFGYEIVGPETGDLAGGDEGVGRMSEPDDIVAAVTAVLGPKDLSGWRVVVTAGGTREPIDPVRYLGNRSSGKMGHALAEEAAHRGADVTLVTASSLETLRDIDAIRVETADEMAAAVSARVPGCDVAVLAAAVADFKPAEASSDKLRRADGAPEVRLVPTPDILAGVSAAASRPFLVGFAAEVGGIDAAKAKAHDKGVDLMVANDVSAPGSGFGTDTNAVTLITPDGTVEPWPQLDKREVARRLWDRIVEMRSKA